MTIELFGALNRLGRDISDSPVSPAQAAELLGLVADGTISGTTAKAAFEKMLETGDGGTVIVDREGLKRTSDTGAIEAEIANSSLPTKTRWRSIRAARRRHSGFFVGQTMKARANRRSSTTC